MRSGSQGGNGNSFSNGPVNIYAKNQRLQGFLGGFSLPVEPDGGEGGTRAGTSSPRPGCPR